MASVGWLGTFPLWADANTETNTTKNSAMIVCSFMSMTPRIQMYPL